MAKRSRREHLLEVALDLFSREGFHATGIDRILAEAQVAKMTLYKHFKSKDELIVAALRLKDQQFNDSLVKAIEGLMADKYRGQPLGVVNALFDAVGEWVSGEDFYGCTFINACAEYSDLSNPIHRLVADHKLAMVNIIRALITPLQVDKPDYLAQQLAMLIDGAIVTAQTTDNRDAIDMARDAALTLCSAANTAAEVVAH